MSARVALRPNNRPQTIDDFPDGTVRSCDGALHLFPATFRTVTDGELAHLIKRFKPHEIEVIEHAPDPGKPPVAAKQADPIPSPPEPLKA